MSLDSLDNSICKNTIPLTLAQNILHIVNLPISKTKDWFLISSKKHLDQILLVILQEKD